ncbi:hypothetical protein NFI96_001450 [Prochilodus magdalenae]|nr:hypothetical protein NFI96_001450 [Prochilodus magdalenae]
MASRVNKRNCRSQGWDNAVPVCEVVKCPTIQTSGDVIATGNTEEASFDDVIHFECASLQLMLDGPQDIHCTEQGTWSARVPKCIEITCLLGPLTPGIISRTPEGKNVFRVGESVEITCSERYWLVRTKLTKKTIRCTDSGEWEHQTVCEEIACEVPYDEEHLYYRAYYYFGGDRRLGVRKSYQCKSGYRKGAEEAMCTENGWVPKPLCTEIVCPKLTFENANPLEKLQDTYKPGAHVYYRCKHELESYQSYITCNRHGDWDNKEWFLRHCIQQSTCSKPEAIKNGIIKEPPWVEDQYARGRTVEYKCSAGYVFENENSARCVGPRWTYPKCIPNTCASHKLDNGLLHHVPDSSRVYYSCNEGYKTTENTWWGETSCRQGSLVPTPQCISENKCGRFPNIPHGKRSSADSFTLECDLGYKADTSSITCDKGQWKIPKLRTCILDELMDELR